MVNYRIRTGQPYPLGVTSYADGFNIAISIPARKECGMLLYRENQNAIQIPFSKKYLSGDLYTIFVEGLDIKKYVYQFYKDEERHPDPYGKRVFGREVWGDYQGRPKELYYSTIKEEFGWQGDRPLNIPYCDSILYSLHVRGFTKHGSSKVRGKGTFTGLMEKIPYLKELGITGIELMPIYEFDEIIKNAGYTHMDEMVAPYMDKAHATWEYKINYWGFTKGDYFAPKAAYAHTDDPVKECKTMVRELHKNGIEVLMQIYFPDSISWSYMYEVLKFWVREYHIDGFHLMGQDIPMKLLSKDPLLGKTKLIGERMDLSGLYRDEEKPEFKNTALFHEEFMYEARKYLKGDGDMLSKIAELFRKNPPKTSVVNFLTCYQGFTLNDLVSYDKKHNEDNGENNKDGSDYNYSWNCGAEGRSRKKQVLELRKKQIRNAWLMLFLAQGTPMLLSGDEFLNSGEGNNNPYCQDNRINWLNWKQAETNREMVDFVKFLIQTRKDHPIFHKEEQLRIMDYISCGYPDLSYHGNMAWYPQFENYNRHLGVMLCGKYAKVKKRRDDDFFYIAYNMHWTEQEFALPKLPSGFKWYILTESEKGEYFPQVHTPSKKQTRIMVPERSIFVLIGKRAV